MLYTQNIGHGRANVSWTLGHGDATGLQRFHFGLGGVVGGGLGAAVGHAHDKHKCDQRGAYWNYSDTVPYQSSPANPDPNAAGYTSRGCRLAPAQVSGEDYRYVRVCPDANGRYRVTS